MQYVSVFDKYSLGGDTTAPSWLYARLCHAFLVISLEQLPVSSKYRVIVVSCDFSFVECSKIVSIAQHYTVSQKERQ